MQERPVRRVIRLKKYDYSQDGMYFVTICTRNRENIFWDGAVRGDYQFARLLATNYPGLGMIVDKAIQNIEQCYVGITVEKYVVMPNHVHMLLFFQQSQSEHKTESKTLQNVVKQMKSYVTKQSKQTVWQKSFYDHVIRNEEEFQHVWRYIDENPLKWEMDCYYEG